MLFSTSIALLLGAAPIVSAGVVRRATTDSNGVAEGLYRRLPVGEIKANGWLLDQMKLQNAALGGQMQKFCMLRQCSNVAADSYLNAY